MIIGQLGRTKVRRAALCILAPASLFCVASAHADITGFGGDGTGFTLNGGATVTGDVLSLTEAVNSQGRTAFFNTQQPITSGGFVASFTYTATSGGTPADGFAFILQNDPRGAAAKGDGGGALAYNGGTTTAVIHSSGVLFNLYPPNGGSATSFRMNGGTGTPYASVAPIDFMLGPTNITLTYDGVSTLTEQIVDGNSQTFTKVYNNILPRYLANGANNVYVGFGGGTGGLNAAQAISNFSFTTNGVQIALVQDVTQAGDPLVGSSSNTPGAEGVANAVDGNPRTKYLNFDKLNTGFVITPAAGLTNVVGLALTSANDAPERDPASYLLEGSNDDGATWSPISSGAVAAFATRFEEQDIMFTNPASYLKYRVTFPTVANAAGANSMQIGEVELLGTIVPEPASLSILALAGMSLLARRRRA